MRIQITIVTLLCSFSVFAQTFTDDISKELGFEKPSAANALIIANLNGSVRVTAYTGTTVRVEATRTIQAKSDARLETGKKEVQVVVIDRADTLIVYVADGCHSFGRRTGRHSGWQVSPWGYESTPGQACHNLYDYSVDFVVKVPSSINLMVSTVNNGNVEAENINGEIKASNINGSIRLINLESQAQAHSVNGDVEVSYVTNPGKECRFYTLNGHINAVFPRGLSANLAFESFNGDLYTNLSKVESLPPQIHRSNRNDGLIYRIAGNQFKIGNGGPLLDFETFNGNVYLKEN